MSPGEITKDDPQYRLHRRLRTCASKVLVADIQQLASQWRIHLLRGRARRLGFAGPGEFPPPISSPVRLSMTTTTRPTSSGIRLGRHHRHSPAPLLLSPGTRCCPRSAILRQNLCRMVAREMRETTRAGTTVPCINADSEPAPFSKRFRFTSKALRASRRACRAGSLMQIQWRFGRSLHCRGAIAGFGTAPAGSEDRQTAVTGLSLERGSIAAASMDCGSRSVWS